MAMVLWTWQRGDACRRNFLFGTKHLVGNFNAHLRDKLLVFADEAFWAGDKRAEDQLKAMVTEENNIVELYSQINDLFAGELQAYELELILSPTLRLISSSVIVGGKHVSLHACQSIIALKL